MPAPESLPRHELRSTNTMCAKGPGETSLRDAGRTPQQSPKLDLRLPVLDPANPTLPHLGEDGSTLISLL